jgi:hypothetical protein
MQSVIKKHSNNQPDEGIFLLSLLPARCETRLSFRVTCGKNYKVDTYFALLLLALRK